MKDIKIVHLTNFLYYIENLNLKRRKNKNHSKNTKDSYIKSLRSFFTFISDNNEEMHTYDKIFKNLHTTDTSKQQDKIVHLNEDEVIKLMNTLQRQKSASKNSYLAFRNSLLIKLMLYGGLRISEALELKLEDITYDENRNLNILNIVGKGGKKQTAHISADVIEDELAYLKEINYLLHAYIFTTSSGKQLKRDEAYRIVNSIYKKALINKKGLHILRHTFAMRLTQNGESPFVIQRLLRHNSLATTTVYAKANISDMGQALGKL
jgi:integrase/recombinase XerD